MEICREHSHVQKEVVMILVFIRRVILNVLHPLIVWYGDLDWPFSRRKVNGKIYRKAYSKLVPGDIIVTRKRGEPTNVFIPGFYTHSMLYVGESNVVEATSLGVHKTDILDALMTKDYFAVVRPKFCSQVEMKLIANTGKKLDSMAIAYDYGFEPNNGAFYCSELIFHCYKHVLENKFPFEMRKTLGVDTVTPQDYFNAKKKFYRVFESKGFSCN